MYLKLGDKSVGRVVSALFLLVIDFYIFYC